MNLVLLGPPGAGKGTQARMLEHRLQVPQIASGDLLREAVRSKTTLGMKAHNFMERGELVPDSLVLGIIGERLNSADARNGFILDGFPRNVHQAQALEELLKEQGRKVEWVVALIVPKEEIVKRISGRRTCQGCQAMYHVEFEPPRQPGRCDKCGGVLYQRDDDSEETVSNRLEVYAHETAPLMDYYRKRGELAAVDGLGTQETILERIMQAIGNSHDARPK